MPVLSPTLENDLDTERETPPPPPRKGRWSRSPVHRRRRRIFAGVAVVLAVCLIWLAVSLGGALTNPALGSSMSARLAEWAREHGGASVVNWAENEWYSHHQPKIGGALPKGTIHKPKTVTTAPASVAVPHLPAPAPIVPIVSPAVSGEGQWSPAGRLVDGVPAIYTTVLRPSAIHTSYVVGIAWMDATLLKATLYSGSQIPGGGPYSHTAPVSPNDATSLVAAFNAGFLMPAANGGYYTDGKTIDPLRNGAASFVVYKNGSSTVGQWGRDVSMTSDVVSVRQNLDLLVDNGQVVPAAYNANATQWGATLGGADYVWRSALGVTANGALVYVGGPGLNIVDLANILVKAGAVRAMELDINTDWVNFSSYQPSTPKGPASATNGTELLSGMTGTPGRYFASWWARDFITLSAPTSATR
ncbi:MAG TPA: phosphodiester glycosidase family protein [Acidimicrobiales bacterium]|nr:phosphodiester glycosidase family protein [Acidimicrobiales bacterium]